MGRKKTGRGSGPLGLRGRSYGPFESPATAGMNPTARNKRFYGACLLGPFVGPNILSFDTRRMVYG
jgi:hypothetical protein